MKRTSQYEAVAAISAIVGAGVLVTGLMPFINPGFLDANETGEYSPRMIFLVGTLLSLPLLGMAWHFNKKAQAIRQKLEDPAPVPEAAWERKLKWIVCGVVILFVLITFLW